MSDSVDKAWDALPPQEEIGEYAYDPTPEAAALRKLFDTSAFRLLDGRLGGGEELDGAAALQERIAEAYLFAIDAHRSKPTERCLFCGTAVTPGSLIGNALANGAMPKMAEQAIKTTRLYTDELGALRKRVAELEASLRSVAVVLHAVPDEHRRWDASLPTYLESLAGNSAGNSTGSPPAARDEPT